MSSTQLLSLGGWTILPNLVTGWVQSIWYGITIRAGDPRPQPGTPKFVQHRRRIHIIVVSAYLLYTIYEADWDIRRAGDFYQDLSLQPGAADREIKSRFRRLAAIYHPDKLSSSSTTTSAPSEGYFQHLKLAQDTLLDPAKRFAYDRFGPAMTTWQHCSTVRDYLQAGMRTVVPYYGAGAVFMYIFGLLGYLQWGKYWRWLSLVILAVFEFHTITRPYFPPLAENLINPVLTTFTNHPPYLPFQIIQLSRKIAVTLYIAISQIGPLLQNPEVARQQANQEVVLKQQLDRLDALMKATDVEASRLMAMEMAAFAGDAPAIRDVKAKIKDWLVQNTIRADPEVKDAMGNILKRRRSFAPVGSRGNR